MTPFRFLAIIILIGLTSCASNNHQNTNDVLFMVGLKTDPQITKTLNNLAQKPGLQDELFRYAFNPKSNISFQTIYDWLQTKAYLENSRDMRYLAAMSYLAALGGRKDIATQAYIFAMFQARAEATRCVDVTPANRRIELMRSQLNEIEKMVFSQPRSVRAKNIELAIERQRATEKSTTAYALCQPFNSGLSNSDLNKSLVTSNDLNSKLPEIIKDFKLYYLR